MTRYEDDKFLNDIYIDNMIRDEEAWEKDFDEQYGDITNDHDEYEVFEAKLTADPEYVEFLEGVK